MTSRSQFTYETSFMKWWTSLDTFFVYEIPCVKNATSIPSNSSCNCEKNMCENVTSGPSCTWVCHPMKWSSNYDFRDHFSNVMHDLPLRSRSFKGFSVHVNCIKVEDGSWIRKSYITTGLISNQLSWYYTTAVSSIVISQNYISVVVPSWCINLSHPLP